jgi:hypothetical protein
LPVIKLQCLKEKPARKIKIKIPRDDELIITVIATSLAADSLGLDF